MSGKFSIQDFIDNRWAEARIELESFAPTFVLAVLAYDGLRESGFVLPEGLLTPEQRFPVGWNEILESTMDVAQAMERLNVTLELLKGNSELRLARYYSDVWLQSAYSLCEKVEGLISHAGKIHSFNKKTKRGHHARIKSEIRDEIDNRRTSIVHGANRPEGKVPITATVITERGLWEGLVLFGSNMNNKVVEEMHKQGRVTAQDYFAVLTDKTQDVISRLGVVLEGVEQDISGK